MCVYITCAHTQQVIMSHTVDTEQTLGSKKHARIYTGTQANTYKHVYMCMFMFSCASTQQEIVTHTMGNRVDVE